MEETTKPETNPVQTVRDPRTGKLVSSEAEFEKAPVTDQTKEIDHVNP